MDNFQYTLRIKEIDSFKTLKAKEEFIREMQKLLSNGWSNIPVESDQQSYQNIFKCITKCQHTYTRALPDFIDRTITSGHKDLMRFYMDKKSKTEYATVIDTFQYVTEAEMPLTSIPELKVLASIFMANPLTFKFNHRLAVASSFSTMFSQILTHVPGNASMIFQVEEIKRSIPHITYSILEDILKGLYNQAPSDTNFTLAALESVKNMVTVAKTYEAKVNG